MVLICRIIGLSPWVLDLVRNLEDQTSEEAAQKVGIATHRNVEEAWKKHTRYPKLVGCMSLRWRGERMLILSAC